MTRRSCARRRSNAAEISGDASGSTLATTPCQTPIASGTSACQPDPLLDPAVADGELPYRARSVEMEALDSAMPFGGDGAAAPSVGEQWDMPLADDQLGVRLGKHQGTAERRVNGCDQQPMVTPGQCQRDGTGRIGAASIADPPLAA